MASIPSIVSSLVKFTAGLHDHSTPITFAQHILSGIQPLIPSDYNSWVEILHAKPPKVAAVFSPQNPQATSLLPVFTQHLRGHPIYRHWQESGRYHIATRWSDVASWPEIERTSLYTEFYRPLGVRHQMMVGLQTKPSHFIYLALNRNRTPFSNQDCALLTTLQPHIAVALQSLLKKHRLLSALTSYATFMDTFGQGIICLAPDGHIRWTNKRARADLQTHFGWPSNATRLPTDLQKQLSPRPTGASSPPRSFSISSKHGLLRAHTVTAKTDRYIFFQSGDRHTFNGLKTFGLTNREAEVLGWIARGKSNDETAAILGVGPHTVKKHLERIYNVLGVANRTEAAAKAYTILGGPSSP